jgi:heptosyltransferase-1
VNVLIIKPSSLGDVIHALPFLNAVKERYPDCRVDWVISKKLRGIVDDHPLIDRLIVLDKDSWKSIFNLHRTIEEILRARQELQRRTYDIVADLQGLLRSGIITFVTRSPLKIGFLNAREGSRYFYNKRVSTNGCKHAVDRNLKIAKAIDARTPVNTYFWSLRRGGPPKGGLRKTLLPL